MSSLIRSRPGEMNDGHTVVCSRCKGAFEVDKSITITPEYCPYCGMDPEAHGYREG